MAVEDVDSDNDPGQSSNRSEIEENTQPGWTAGKNNHAYFKNGSVQESLEPPQGIIGSLDPVPQNYLIGGTVSGLLGSGLSLQNKENDILPISGNGEFVFSTPLPNGSFYDVTVKAQPFGPSQTCEVADGSGTLSGADVTDVVVTCATNSYTVGGTVSGLNGTGLTLQNNGGDNLLIGADGAFQFSSEISSGELYAVTVLTQPSNLSQTCSVSSGSGTVSNANISNIQVTCVTNSYTVGGTVTGLLSSGLILQLNGDELEGVTSDGAYTFDTQLEDGSAYQVLILTAPTDPGMQCTVSNGSGALSGENVTDVGVECVIPGCYAITRPDGGESWVAGQDYAINWSKVGNDCAATVDLELYEGGVFMQTIVSGTSDTSYIWSIPSDQAIGFDYTVKVVDSVTASYSAESAGPFVINSPFCNTQIAPMVTEFGVAAYEACDTLIVPPGFTGASGSEVRLSSGRDVVVEPGASFELGGLLETAVCGQSLCETSAEPMPEDCHSCVEAVCLADSSCCTLEWDQACVDLVATECSLTCE